MGNNEVCDDYYGNDPEDITKWIDNDCKNQANCLDQKCYNTNKKGPSGGPCCHALGDCTGVLNEPNSAYVGCSAATKWECDCKGVYTEAAALNWITMGTTLINPVSLSSSGTYSTCVNKRDALFYSEDKIVKVNVASGTGHSFSLSATDVDGGDDCESSVILRVYSSTDRESILAQVIAGSPAVTQTSPTTDYFYFTFENIRGEDCLVSVMMT